MPVYIMLSSLTAQGVQTLKSNPDRLREVNKDVEELGAKVLHQWATLGPFDFVNVVEAPDAATIARVSIALGARGSAKLQTLTALEIEDFLAAVTPFVLGRLHQRSGGRTRRVNRELVIANARLAADVAVAFRN